MGRGQDEREEEERTYGPAAVRAEVMLVNCSN